MPAISPVAHGRAWTMTAVIDHTTAIEAMLARQLPPEVVAQRGPRYQNLKSAWIDIQRVYESLRKIITDRRDADPAEIVNHLIALAGQALKAADDTAIAAKTPLSVSSVNIDSTFAVLEQNNRDD